MCKVFCVRATCCSGNSGHSNRHSRIGKWTAIGQWTAQVWLLLLLLFTWQCHSTDSPSTISSLSITSVASSVQNVLYNRKLMSLYIGATDSVYLFKDDQWQSASERFVRQLNQLTMSNQFETFNSSQFAVSDHLRFHAHFATNTLPDHDQCLPVPSACAHNRSTPVNHNRLLVHVPQSNANLILACGTAYQGMCHIVSEIDNELTGDLLGKRDLTSNWITNQKSNVGFVVPVARSHVFFFASQPDDRPLTFQKPTFSARKLNISRSSDNRPEVNFVYRYDKAPFRTSLQYQSALLAKHALPVEYVYGFHYGQYAYILKNELINQDGGKGASVMETRLGRVCLEDDSFFSYSEIPLNCNVSSHSSYHSDLLNANERTASSSSFELIYEKAMAADLGEADAPLAQRLKLFAANKTLFVAFGSMQTNAHKPTAHLAAGSVICAFSIEQIVEHFEKSTISCLNGDNLASGLMNHFEGVDNDHCQPVARSSIKDQSIQCHGSNLDHYIESRLTAHGMPFLRIPQHIISSLKVSAQGINNAFQTLLIGTDSGVLIKASRQVNGKMNIASEIKVSNAPIVPNLPMDASKQYVYVATDQQVLKYPLASCSLYADSCAACVTALEPLGCGWLSAGPNNQFGTCISRTEYERIENNLPHHQLSHEQCAPKLLNFHPKSGPVSGGTKINLIGSHLWANDQTRTNPNYSVNITVGNQECAIELHDAQQLTCVVPAKNDQIDNQVGARVRVCIKDFTRIEHKLYDVDGCSEIGHFKYVESNIEQIWPTYGPISGGTIVHLSGQNLDSGSDKRVLINEVQCEMIAVNQTQITCRTGRLKVIDGISDDKLDDYLDQVNGKGSIEYHVDHDTWKFNTSKVQFEYRNDPVVREFKPRAVVPGIGMYFTFFGKNFDSVHSPRLMIKVIGQKRDLQLNTPCLIQEPNDRPNQIVDTLMSQHNLTFAFNADVNKLSVEGGATNESKESKETTDDADQGKQSKGAKSSKEQRLICLVPALPADWPILSSKAPLVAYLNLSMDASTGFSKHLSSSPVFLYPMPQLRPPAKQVKIRTGSRKSSKVIRIEGNNLSTEYPVKVQISSLDNTRKYYCSRWQSINHGSMECEIPNTGIPDQQVQISLIVGRLTLAYGQADLGEVRMDENSWLFWMIMLFAFIVIGFVGVFLVRNQILLPKLIWWNQDDKSKKMSVSYNNVRNSSNYSLGTRDSLFNSSTLLSGNLNAISMNPIPESITEMLAREDILIPRSCLEIGDKLGTGYFGCVYKGILKLPTQQEPLDVAVKTLKNASESPDAVNAFLGEALRMKDFRNDHVLALIGVCVQPDISPMLVLPYMANGDLLSYIRAPEHRPTVRQLLCYGIDVSLGMAYLSSLKYVHRDLAARNVMLDDRLRAKVADFGLTRDVYERSYYAASSAAEVPVKWMAPECIEKLIATSQGDVWSYGVLLWELMTRGNHPYPVLDNSQVLDYVKSGQRMRRPETCPLEVYELMLDCWNLRPEHRPTFDDIADRLQAIISDKQPPTSGHAVESIYDMQPDLIVTYANYPVEQYYNTRPTIPKSTTLPKSSPSKSYMDNGTLKLPNVTQPITMPVVIPNYANLTDDEIKKPMLNTFKPQYESEL